MKSYPTIPNSDKIVHEKLMCIAFKKYDGSCLRFEWNKRLGWYKFGTRTRLFDIKDEEYGFAISIFDQNFAKTLAHLFIETFKCDSAIAYCEFFGNKSFAGQHVKDDPKQLVLFDVNVHKKGFVAPDSFVEIFSSVVPSAEVVYRGQLNSEYVSSVRAQLEGEGVVCKGGQGHKIWMCKIKTNAYLEKLKKIHGSLWVNYWE